MKRYGKHTALVARLALGAIFIYSGFAKLAAPEAAAATIATTSLPAPYFLTILAGVAELAGGLALAAGFLKRWAAVGLALFLLPATAFFHNPMGLEGPAAHAALIQLYKNLAILGGLLAVSVLWARGVWDAATASASAGAAVPLASRSAGARGAPGKGHSRHAKESSHEDSALSLH